MINIDSTASRHPSRMAHARVPETVSPTFISVVSPVYAADKILPTLCERLDAVLSALRVKYEIILVCDGSPDRSWDVMSELVRRYDNLIIVKLSRNFGQHYAITAGLDISVGEWALVMDCDLQDRPEEIPKMLAKAQEGFDIVLARRVARKHRAWKQLTSHLFAKTFTLLSGHKIDSSVGSFRLMHRKVVDGFCGMRETYRLFAGMIEWLGFNSCLVDVQHDARLEGESSYNLRRLLRMASDGIFSFSNRPLYISIALGVFFSLLSGLYGLYLVIDYFTSQNPQVAGWRSTITAISFFGGLILVNQGVLGVYIGRLYNQAKGRPLYVAERIVVGKGIAHKQNEDVENGVA